MQRAKRDFWRSVTALAVAIANRIENTATLTNRSVNVKAQEARKVPRIRRSLLTAQYDFWFMSYGALAD
jgi:hypothetical protein